MLETYPIEFVRQAIEQTLYEQHLKNPNYFGGKGQMAIVSYFQQLRNGAEVNRYVECFNDIAKQQNRTDLIGIGIVDTNDNPTITNLYSCLIVPMEWKCGIRVQLENRAEMVQTLNNLTKELKGIKLDMAQLKGLDENGKPYVTPFVVGTVGYNEGAPKLENGNYIGSVENAAEITDNIEYYGHIGIDVDNGAEWVYCEHDSKLKVGLKGKGGLLSSESIVINSFETVGTKVVASVTVFSDDPYQNIPLIYGAECTLTLKDEQDNTYESECVCKFKSITQNQHGYVDVTFECVCNDATQGYLQSVTQADIRVYKVLYSFISDDGSYPNIIFPPEHTSFEKFKLSISFDAMRCNTPKSLNGKEYCTIFFGGAATLVNNGVKLGNDLMKISVHTKCIEGQADYTNPTEYYLEPLEMPSGNNINTKVNQLVSNNFKTNSHADALSITKQFTFICDETNPLLEKWYDYGRDGDIVQAKNGVSPNMIYATTEYYCSWGNYKKKTRLTKIIESVDTENTESDTMTLSITMQVQGENH